MPGVIAVAVWWVLVEIIGLAVLPLTFRFLGNLPDQGYSFTKPLGLLLLSIIFWLLVSLGYLTNSLNTIWIVLLLLGGISLAMGWRARVAWLGFWQRQRKLVLAVELLFMGTLVLWAIFRAYNPEITATEKPMEIMFLNSILRSETFPPQDAWLAGFGISYYYLGYVIVGILTQLSGIASAVTFNLAIALLFALAATGAFGVVYNLIECSRSPADTGDLVSTSSNMAIWIGILGAMLLVVIGNLEGILEVLHAQGWGNPAFWDWLDIKNLATAPRSTSWIPQDNWWWWRASRVLHDKDLLGNSIEVIDEFPFFSFLLGDMHPHVLSLPFTLLSLGLSLNLLLERPTSDSNGGGLLPPFLGGNKGLEGWLTLLYPICLGALGFLNSWDFPTYTLVAIGAYAIQRYLYFRSFSRQWWLEIFTGAAYLIGAGLLLYLPFYLSFSSQAGGLRLVQPWIKTHFQQYFIMFGPFITVVVVFFGYHAWKWRSHGIKMVPEAWIIGGGLIPLLLVGIIFQWWTVAFTALALALGLMLLFHKLRLVAETAAKPVEAVSETEAPAKSPPDFPGAIPLGNPTSYAVLFVLLLVSLAFALTLATEFVYIKDVFSSRMNTVFKFYYQAWTLLAVSSAFGIFYLVHKLSGAGRGIFTGIVTVLLALCLVYPVAAGISKANYFKSQPTPDGMVWLQNIRPDMYAVIRWFNEHVDGAPVMVEAPGPQYSPELHNYISAYTGIPTLLGWGGHENQWRGNYDEPGRREPQIQQLYQSMDLIVIQKIMDQYRIQYVILGPLEQEKYSLNPQQMTKFSRFMDVAFKSGNITVYQRR
ncbi:MAG: hypothetical protein HY326_03205 [Chloroflexi bacterium]|nr:hypothetical protein [Chloroflexota bacterium]